MKTLNYEPKAEFCCNNFVQLTGEKTYKVKAFTHVSGKKQDGERDGR